MLHEEETGLPLSKIGGPEFIEALTRKIAEKFWGIAEAADYSSYKGKALAAKKIQDRTYAHERLILCNARWPMIHNPSTDDHVGDPNLAARIFSAVTGRELDYEELNKIGESIFNLQRAILLRQEWGDWCGSDKADREPIITK